LAFFPRYRSNSAIEQDEASLAHRARRNALSWDSFTASRARETNLYQTLHVHVNWTWQHKISIPFTWHNIIPNSLHQNGIGRLPDFSFPLTEWKVWHAGLHPLHVLWFKPHPPTDEFSDFVFFMKFLQQLLRFDAFKYTKTEQTWIEHYKLQYTHDDKYKNW